MFSSIPPHTATLGRGSAVVKIVWLLLPFSPGNEGKLQSLVLGNNSLEESQPKPAPPVKSTMVSSLEAFPGCFVMIDDDN